MVIKCGEIRNLKRGFFVSIFFAWHLFKKLHVLSKNLLRYSRLNFFLLSISMTQVLSKWMDKCESFNAVKSRYLLLSKSPAIQVFPLNGRVYILWLKHQNRALGLGVNSPRASALHSHHLRNGSAGIQSHPNMRNHLLCDTLFRDCCALHRAWSWLMRCARFVLDHRGAVPQPPPTHACDLLQSQGCRKQPWGWLMLSRVVYKMFASSIQFLLNMQLSCFFLLVDQTEWSSGYFSYFCQRGVAVAMKRCWFAKSIVLH